MAKALKPTTFRCPVDWLPYLQAAQFLRRHDSMQELLMAIIGDFVTENANMPEVQAALRARLDWEARLSRPVVSLPEAKQTAAQSLR